MVSASANAPQPVPSVVAMPMPVRELPPTKAEVIQALKDRRAKNLKSFIAYRKGGVYPHNSFRRGPLNVWMDAEGHLCAAATMIDKDGKHDLVEATATSNNNIRLLDVVRGDLLDWILTSGFTIEEIDRIQAPQIMPDEWMLDFRQEDSKLAAGYAKTEKALVKNQKASLELAAKRLMENPHLARQLVDGML
ncbi:MAG TPA: hypothetical protein VMZ53_31855 [Kofleriaceae bacterium]|nr:hypothetical protein [Kofleriaceae bacterium]